MKREITYPAIITYEDDVYFIGFPDFEEEFYGTYAETFEDSIKAGKDYLFLLVQDNIENLPKPMNYKDAKALLKENQELTYINFDYNYEKSLVELSYTKKTLTIPTYLDILAKNSKINFSQLLQKALKEELNIN